MLNDDIEKRIKVIHNFVRDHLIKTVKKREGGWTPSRHVETRLRIDLGRGYVWK